MPLAQKPDGPSAGPPPVDAPDGEANEGDEPAGDEAASAAKESGDAAEAGVPEAAAPEAGEGTPVAVTDGAPGAEAGGGTPAAASDGARRAEAGEDRPAEDGGAPVPAQGAAPPEAPSGEGESKPKRRRSKVDELFARIRAERQSSERRAKESRPSESRPSESRAPESRPSESRPFESRPPESRPPGGTVVVADPPSPARDRDDQPTPEARPLGPVAAAADEAPEPSTNGATHEPGSPDSATRKPAPRPAPSEPDPEADAALLRARDAALDGVEAVLARRLKRVLADEQNEVLDLVRQSMPETIDDLVPERAEHAGRYAAAAAPEIDAAAAHGAAAVGDGTAGPHRELAAELGDALVGPLRERVVRSLDECGGDRDELMGRLRALYREWKGQRIGEAVRHYAAAAFAAGAFDAAHPQAELRWLVDTGGEPCPDADDNALATGVRKGEPFPTGDRCPPAHPGCRCLVVPVPFPSQGD